MLIPTKFLLSQNQLLFLCCMLFAVGGVYMIIDEDESCRFVIKFIVAGLV